MATAVAAAAPAEAAATAGGRTRSSIGSRISGPVMLCRDDLPDDARHLAGEVPQELVERNA